MAVSALILVADGSEEMETITPFDVFIRSSFDTTLAYVPPAGDTSSTTPQNPMVKLSRGLVIQANARLSHLSTEKLWDVVVVPGGGPGAKTLSESKAVLDLVKRHHGAGKTVGMICAGSLVAKAAGIGGGKAITSHPSVKEQLASDYFYSEERVVYNPDDKLFTSRGPGTALAFSLDLVEHLAGKAKRDEVQGPMICSEKL